MPIKFLFLLSFLASPLVIADEPDKKAAAETKPESTEKPSDPVTREGRVTIDGSPVAYRVVTGKLQLKKENGKPTASIFHVSYFKKDVADLSTRPVLFAFNGGPGSSAVWLHLGMLGPYRVDLPGDGTSAPIPPAGLIENPFSILDRADLVFVDPVSTGYSRVEKAGKPKDFHGVQEDIESIGDFVRRWITENDRWDSPKYLLGESYGGIRVAGVAEHLQSRYGMSLNGVVLLSSLLDFRTLRGSHGDDLAHLTFLPTFTAVAHYHGHLEGDAEKLIAEARQFAFGPYATALLKGNTLSAENRQQLALRLAELTSIDPQVFLDADLRLSPSQFRSELLKEKNRVIGRFDARVSWPAKKHNPSHASYDPSYSLAYGAYSTAMLTYLSQSLGWKEHSPYEILTGNVHPWNWGHGNRIVNLTKSLEAALQHNPHLRVLIMKGNTDLATPGDAITYSINQILGNSESLTERISYADYQGGHMFYFNPPDLKKSRDDLLEFISP